MTDIGFHDFEVGVPQRLLVTVELWLDPIWIRRPTTIPSARGIMTICAARSQRIATERRYNLQETLVHAIFERVAAYRGVKALRVKSVKPDIYEDAKGVGVEIASFAALAPS
jgi:dihydroneopterin aldolase